MHHSDFKGEESLTRTIIPGLGGSLSAVVNAIGTMFSGESWPMQKRFRFAYFIYVRMIFHPILYGNRT